MSLALTRYRTLSPGELVLELPPAGERRDWPWTVEPTDRCPADQVPRISVITPSYNQGDFLEEAIRSVLLQGYSNLEYIVVDGGSTDDSASIIREYAPFLDDWVSEPDRGQSDAINKGFARATGDVVVWLNSDDRFRPGTLRTIAQEFGRDEESVLIYGDIDIIDGAGNVIGHLALPPFDAAAILSKDVVIAQPAAFVRRSAVGGQQFVRPTFHYAMDFDLWLRLIRRGRARHVEVTLSDFRLWDESKSSAQKLRWAPELLRAIDDFFDGPGLPPEYSRLERRARSGVLSTSGIFRYEAGDAWGARAQLLRAASLHPPNLWRSPLGARLVRSMLGDRWFGRLLELRRQLSAD